MPLQPGDTLGDRYVLEHRLGEGGMADVWVARDPKLNRRVAVKQLKGDLSDVDIARFGREVKALMLLNHPHVLSLVDHGTYDDRPYVVVELLDGGDLDFAVRKVGPVPADALAALAVKLLSGMAAAHALGIVHRDLKPANLYLCADGRPVVLDFGLARGTSETKAGQTMARGSGTTLTGTPSFLAPEQIDGVLLSAQSDLFSLGSSFFFLLAGAAPFAGRNALEVMLAIGRNERKPLPPCPPALGAAIERLMHPDPKRRPRDAGEAQAEMERAMTPTSEKSLRRYAQTAWSKTPPEDTSALVLSRETVKDLPRPEATGILTSPVTAPGRTRSMTVSLTMEFARRWTWFPIAAGLGAAITWVVMREEPPAAPPPLAPVARPVEAALPPPQVTPVPEPVREVTPEPVPEAKKKSYLTCVLKQWAEVWVDGQSRGKQQLVAKIELAPGMHTLTFRNSQYGERSTTITIKRGQDATVTVDFPAQLP